MKLFKVLAVFILFALLPSCKENVPTIDFIQEMKGLIPKIEEISHRGNFSVWKTKNEELNMAFETSNKIYTYTLQGAKGNYSDLKNGNYQLIYLKSAILLFDTNKEKLYYISLDDDEGKKYLTVVPKKYKQISYIEGFGLVRRINSDKRNFEDKKSKKKSVLSEQARHCTSGGIGATSCSVSIGGPEGRGCSVNCSSGFYACCTSTGNYTYCECRQLTPY